jgi:hypothetical protein
MGKRGAFFFFKFCLPAFAAPVGGGGEAAQCALGYNEFDFFLENKEYNPFDGCKIEI